MATSQNGWPAHNDTSSFVRGKAAGFGFWCANDDVRVIFEDLVTRFNSIVEAVAGPILDDWSWADRNIRDSATEVSNHASATALDLNALKHPRGVWRTFSESKRKTIRALIARYDGVIRWGGDYTVTPDDMHFEINAGKAAVKKVADKIRAEIKQAEESIMPLTEKDAKLIAKELLKYQVELTEQGAINMSSAGTKRTPGEKISLSYIWQWGGGGLYRVYGRIDSLEKKLDQVLKAIKKPE